jgi:hypothetical protein
VSSIVVLFEGGSERAADGCGSGIFQRNGNLYIGATGVRKWEGGDHLRVADFYPAAGSEDDRLPDTSVAVANRGNPVPAFGGDEGRTVKAHDAAVFARATFDGLLLGDTGMGRGRNANRESVGLTGFDSAADVENATDECAPDGAQGLAIKPDGGGVIDSFKRKSEMAAWRSVRSFEFGAIPIVLFV